MVWIPLLLVACAVTAVACARLCRAAVAAGGTGAGTPGEAELTLGEAAFLAGGPRRVTDLALVSMHRARRLLLAHTGWATVVDGSGGDELERAVLGAIGPDGQAPVPRLRPAVAAAPCVRRIEEGLVERGFAVPGAGRREVAAGLRAVRGAFLLTPALAAVSVPLAAEAERAPALAGFALPLTAAGLCWAIGRHPRGRWASHAGQRLLAGLSAEDPLTALATRGPAVLEPELRDALGGP
ncbi:MULTISPECIES: TIGR04222 domain-containing membrane protein [Streptomyces]|uniref:TIGR04222 domain-containing membrane protein n=2 Tax=Streptomyces TaxID=1883 RepID=A0ABU4K9S1_9ACTN|nr:TIGR04222 domain-containing membrane protein [Streptomyces roseolus]MDX2294500.1 TIGR04222 domain-containing membrane protein [Streptomyces roseolus]